MIRLSQLSMLGGLALGLSAVACTPAERDFLGTVVGLPGTVKAGQCSKPLEQRKREWLATGERVVPLDCTGPNGVPDGRPDFGPGSPEAETPAVPVPPARPGEDGL